MSYAPVIFIATLLFITSIFLERKLNKECLSNLPKSPQLLGSGAKDLYPVRLPRGPCS